MQPNRPSGLKRLAIFYLLSVFLATITFSIQDSIRYGRFSLINFLPYDPITYTYLYPSLLTVLLSVRLMTHFVDRRPFVSLGLKMGWPSLRYFVAGLPLSMIYIFSTTCITLYLLFGILPRWQYFTIISDIPQFLIRTWSILIASVYEELVFRGYLLQTLLEVVGAVPAVLLSSITFAMGHYYLAGWISVLNAGLIGILYCIAYLKTRSLWLPIGLHFGADLFLYYLQLQTVPTPGFTAKQLTVFIPGSPTFTIVFVSVITAALTALLLLLLPLRPHPHMQALWDRYIHPAPWPPWRRRTHQESKALLEEPEEPSKPAPLPKDQ